MELGYRNNQVCSYWNYVIFYAYFCSLTLWIGIYCKWKCAVLQLLFLFWFKLCLIKPKLSLYIRYRQGCQYIKLIIPASTNRKKIQKELKKLIYFARIKPSYSSPQQLMPKSLADSDWRKQWIKSEGRPHSIKQYLKRKKLYWSWKAVNAQSQLFIRYSSFTRQLRESSEKSKPTTVCWDIQGQCCLIATE